ncbi:MAG: hypothetical protein KDD58_08510 [Bdellovibrionales bacterium]|nr:hypothetical protein [Bdellovibrionales bacterium]
MELSYFLYQSKYTDTINRFKEQSYSGALFKLTNKQDISGYSAYHALDSFGDMTVHTFVDNLKNNKLSSRHQLILQYLQQDLQDRQLKMDTLAGAFQLENHFLITDFEFAHDEFLQKIRDEKFNRVKLKMGKDLDRETKWIESKLSFFKKNQIQLRLDFNELFSFEEFDTWLKHTGFHKEGVIDFYEDPCVYDKTWWKKWKIQGLRLARDCYELEDQEQHEGVQVFVLKPSRINVIEWLKKLDNPQNYEYVITHYLDSPLGVAQAAASALKMKFFVGNRLLNCGLLMNHSIPSLEWNISNRGPHILFRDDIGLGFSKELGELNWSPLDYKF